MLQEVKFIGSVCLYNDLQAYLVLLHFTLLHFVLHFYKLKVCCNPVSSKSFGAVFQTAFVHFISLSHFGNSKYFKLSHYYLVICDQ